MISVVVYFLIVIFTAAIFLYAVAVYHNGYWKRRGIDGPTSSPFIGNMGKWFRSTPMVFLLREWTKQYGKVYGIQEGISNILVVSDVNMLHELFVKKFEYFHERKSSPLQGDVDKRPNVHVFSARGARWKRLRAIANPIFSVQNLKKILPIMNDSTEVLMEHLDRAYQAGKPFNIHPYFHELTLDIISRIALGQRGSLIFRNKLAPTLKEAFANFSEGLAFFISWAVGSAPSALLRQIILTLNKIRYDPVDSLIIAVKKEVHRRKALKDAGQSISNSGEIVDFIDMFLNIESNDINLNVTAGSSTFDKSISRVSRRLTIEEIVAQCFVFLLAGYDTTANTLGVTCYYLAMNPDAQERMREEILQICSNQEPTYEQINQLKYSDAVMKETLRLTPIAGFACGRKCSKTTALGDYVVEAGTIVQADVFSVQHDKEIWGENVEEFVPERWLSNDGENRPQLSWLPFGAGPRICIGMRLAYLEEKLMLVYILQKYRIVSCEQTELKLVSNSVLNPESVLIKLEAIES